MNAKNKSILEKDLALKRVLDKDESELQVDEFIACVMDMPIEDVRGFETFDKKILGLPDTGKDCKLNVLIRLKDGTTIDVETFEKWDSVLAKRSLCDISAMITTNFDTCTPYEYVPEVYHKAVTIYIIEDGFDLTSFIHSKFMLMEIETDEIFSDMVEQHFINLRKLKELKLPDF